MMLLSLHSFSVVTANVLDRVMTGYLTDEELIYIALRHTELPTLPGIEH